MANAAKALAVPAPARKVRTATPPMAGLVRCEDMARLVGRSVRHISRLVQKGVVSPALEDESGRWFHVDQAEEIQAVTDDSKKRGDTTSSVFTAFEAGASPIKVAIDLKLSPEDVRYFAGTYANLRGGVFLSAEALVAIADLGLSDMEPKSGPPSESELVKILRAAAAGLRCDCEKRRAVVCMHCVRAKMQTERQASEAVLEATEERVKRVYDAELATAAKRIEQLERDLAVSRQEMARATAQKPSTKPSPAPVDADALFDVLGPVVQEATK